jgi:hypothetical protein
MMIRTHVREYCGLRPGDSEIEPGDVELMDAFRAIVDGDGDP